MLVWPKEWLSNALALKQAAPGVDRAGAAA